MSQDDQRELSEIGRSIDSLFTQAEELEKAAADPSRSAAPPQSEVTATPDVGGQPDAGTEPDLTPEPGPLSQAVETAVEPEPTPVEAEPTPVEAEPTPVEPEPTLVEPEPTPVEPEPTPAEPEPTPVELEPTPGEPEPTSVEPGPTPAEPEPTPAEPEPTPVELEPTPGEPEPTSVEPGPTPAEPEPTPVEPEPTPVELEPTSAEPEPTPVEPGPTPAEPEPTSVEPEPAQSEIGKVLSEATSDYLQAPVGERAEEQSALGSAVEAARSARAWDEIASTVDILLLEASWDEDVEDLLGELVDEDVSTQMVVRLGRLQVEEERERLIRAYTTLGDPIAEAIADALTETEDRLARKTYVAALGAFGSAGAHAVEKMLQDSQWFVVRNGVALLGVVGGPDAIEHLTASLANEHAGVRRETVRSLAKVGGENAGLLVTSMLGDSDPEVRAEAARAVAALKAERAYKQLIEILKQGDEDEVLEQVLRALGGLGDASAVSAIEKRVKGSMFSSPPTGVHIAGLSALAAIGTPHAMSLVKKARKHKDPEVSSAAVQLLAGK